MNRLMGCVAVGLMTAVLVAAGSPAVAKAPPPPEGLVAVKSRRMDHAWLLPDADFRHYTKVLVDPAVIAFRKDWQRNMNRTRALAERISDADARAIADATRAGFGDTFELAFRQAGYTITSTPGPDVLRLSPSVIDLYINAPDTMAPARSRSYTTEAGQARLVLEARDSVTGALLGVTTDRRHTRSNGGGPGLAGGLSWTTQVSNRADFRALFGDWAMTCVAGLAELKARSPAAAPQ